MISRRIKRIKRIKRKTLKRRKKGKSYRRRRGGSAVDAGTYGCVFNPAIKCANKNKVDPNTISKLMYSKKTKIELIEIEKIQKVIKDIPDNEKYFLLSNIYECKPDKLTADDLINFDEKCKLFTKRDINSSNVNNNLDKLSLIVMPNGGISINKFFKKILQLPAEEMNKKFVACNNSLIKLLVNGIIPMNTKKFNHYDIKSGNILIGEDGNTRLIDWGLADSNDGFNIPDAIQNHAIVFNLPFSCILFNKFVKKILPQELHKSTLKVAAAKILNESLLQINKGHYDYITKLILPSIYKRFSLKNNNMPANTLIEYIEAVLLVYVDKNGNFNDTKYFYEVFAKNADICGFLTTYLPIIEYGTDKFNPDIIKSMCRILLKYCFSTEFATKPINVDEVVEELKLLNMF